MALIEVKDLKKTYFGEVDTKVLRGITFSIEKGEFVSIMGPSGSGKSTLLHILGFLSEATEGEYKFGGKSFDEYGEDERARIRNTEMGFVFQSFNLLPRQSVYENVRLPLLYSAKPEGEWHGRIVESIDAVGLSHRTDFETYKLSGGERQRVAIARALVNSPEVIFADEPTGNLDSVSGKAVMKTIQNLNQNMEHTVVLITHETYTAEHAERVIRLRDGLLESDEKVSERKTSKDFKK